MSGSEQEGDNVIEASMVIKGFQNAFDSQGSGFFAAYVHISLGPYSTLTTIENTPWACFESYQGFGI
jgi:hypothetical protein